MPVLVSFYTAKKKKITKVWPSKLVTQSQSLSVHPSFLVDIKLAGGGDNYGAVVAL